VIIKKILRSLSSIFDSKVSTIGEAKDINAFTLDAMYGSLTTYEMRINKAKPSNKESVFKVVKGSNPKKIQMKTYLILKNPTLSKNSREEKANTKVSYL